MIGFFNKSFHRFIIDIALGQITLLHKQKLTRP